jgi:hypothetical protein
MPKGVIGWSWSGANETEITLFVDERRSDLLPEKILGIPTAIVRVPPPTKGF